MLIYQYQWLYIRCTICRRGISMNKSKPHKTTSKRIPKRSVPETPTAAFVSTYVPTMFTNPELFVQDD